VEDKDQQDLIEAIQEVGMRLAVDDETVAAGLFAVADAIDRLTDTFARASNIAPTQTRPGRRLYDAGRR
jgi:hypothetical protein